mmetsp:Transcript_11226/g.22405  ORF Transcript_11226/g.22405 Transcript_11226/m.22405 type:complete len:481 (+) Transcript_11226:65-1507(+)
MTEETAPSGDAAASDTVAAAPPSNPAADEAAKTAADNKPGGSLSVATQQHKHIEQHLNSLLTSLQQRQPLDISYDSLLPTAFRKHAKACSSIPKTSTGQNKKSNVLSADVKLYRRLNANLRDQVETYGSTPAGWRRRPNTRRIDIDFGSANNASEGGDSNNTTDVDAKLRAAFALRESKEHEQRDLVNATLKAENVKSRRGWGFSLGEGGAAAAGQYAGLLPPLEDAASRKKRLEHIAKQLKDEEKGADERKKWKKIAKKAKELILNPKSAEKIVEKSQNQVSPQISSIGYLQDSSGVKRKRADTELDQQLQIEEAKKREKILRERIKREEAEHKRLIKKEREEEERRERALDTPRDALHRLYEPIYTALWDLEFPEVGNTNPFRVVIDKNTCAAMGVPDYCDVIEKPMNLTYIQNKVNKKSYDSLQEFLEDVDLIVRNALKYNPDPNNPVHIAAKGLRKTFKKVAKPLVQSLTKGLAAT